MLRSISDLVAVALMATTGVLMAPICPALIAVLLVLAVGSLFGLDQLKVWLFRRLEDPMRLTGSMR